MGKWDHRSRRFYRPRRSPGPPPTYYDINAPLPDFQHDGIPSWEKKYCTLIGSVPWQKIVDSKKLIYCHSNVLNWNDSAAEEAFQNSKKRYWAKLNSLPSDISLPDPDAYIEQIDWNPRIDPELIKELDEAFFAPPDEEQEGNAIKNKRTKTSSNGENPWECAGTPVGRALENKVQGWNQGDCHDDSGNPWECAGTPVGRALENKVQGWNQGDCHDDSGNVDNTDNPWDRGISRGNGGLTNNAWEGGHVKSWGWNEGKDHNNWCRDWNSGCSQEDKGWGKIRNSSWCQQHSDNLANIGKSWEHKSSQQNVIPINTGWRKSGANVSTWKQLEKAEVSNDLQFRRNYGGWTAGNQSYRMRQGSNRQDLGYNGSQFQRGDHQTGQYWRREESKKRDFGP